MFLKKCRSRNEASNVKECSMSNDNEERQVSRGRWVFYGFLTVAGFFLFTEHRAHVLGVFPFLLLLACPLMHLFMHHGRGGHGQHMHNGSSEGERK